MLLRDAKGIIICSEQTILSDSVEFNFQREVNHLKIIKLYSGVTSAHFK